MKIRQIALVAATGLLATGTLGAQTYPTTPLTPTTSTTVTTPARPTPTQAADKTPMKLEGTVVSTSPNEIVITSTDGTRKTFVVDTVTSGQATLKAGDRVNVTYDKLADSRFHAVQIGPLALVTETTTNVPMETTNTVATNDTTRSNNNLNDTTRSNRMDNNLNDTTRSNRMDNNLNDDASTLPRTASNTPGLAVAGLLSLLGAGALALRRRS